MTVVLGWGGIGVAIEATDDELDEVRSHLPAFFTTDVEPIATVTFQRDDDVLKVSVPRGLSTQGSVGTETMRAAASRIELLIVDHMPGLVAVHAGVVAVNDRAIVLAGSSMSGKSTLVRALLDAGATYLSDEFALVLPDGTVRSYPRRMTVRADGGTHRVDPALVHPFNAAPLPVAVLGLLTFSSEGWSIQEMTPAQAVMKLVANGVGLRTDLDGTMKSFVALAENAHCVIGTRGEAADAAEHLLELLRVAR